MSATYDIVALEYLGGHTLRLTFADGVVSDVDFLPRVETIGGPLFEALKDSTYFSQASIDPELRTVVWPNGADFAPDVLHDLAVAAA